MKKLKITYGVIGINEWHTNIPLGKASVRVSFTGGATTLNGVIPASYTTDNPIVQMAIERSQAFLSGKIKKIRSYTTDEEIQIEVNPPKPSWDASQTTPSESTATTIPTSESKESDPSVGTRYIASATSIASTGATPASESTESDAKPEEAHPESVKSESEQESGKSESDGIVPCPDLSSAPDLPESSQNPDCHAIEESILKTQDSQLKSDQASAPTSEEEIEVSCLADARAVLSERFDYPESKIRTTLQIVAAGKAHNITFIGI